MRDKQRNRGLKGFDKSACWSCAGVFFIFRLYIEKRFIARSLHVVVTEAMRELFS